MTTIPSRLATLSRTSVSAAESRKRVIKLYRDWYRSAPEICALFALNYSPGYVRYAIRQKFEANRHVTNQKAIDVLILKGRQEYQETLNGWKMMDQVTGILLDTKALERPNKTFLQKFYEGRDGDGVIPAASGIL
ncbi:NdufA6 NADH-ubiquinone oxidoreductase 14.8 kDa subunit [Crepidotus variabilis]|uniref:NdufA6 NADH-ubiquinone oxidoreductase 14.8 kDa subunit n=1 Tax=Crepidotus variabilis TaxID=179855 RepID=A0A9P6EGF0_9AGAR|nr:NdufA6 NADH-ubiquinone oxidoreductase 14.8 kDa subunit [Crepidotus variabilis]